MTIKSVKQTEQGVFIGFQSNLNVTDLTFKVKLEGKKFYFRPYLGLDSAYFIVNRV